MPPNAAAKLTETPLYVDVLEQPTNGSWPRPASSCGLSPAALVHGTGSAIEESRARIMEGAQTFPAAHSKLSNLSVTVRFSG